MQRRIHPRQERRGLLVLLLLAVMSVASAASLYLFAGQSRLARLQKEKENERAMALARAAVDEVAARVNEGTFVDGSVLDWLSDGADNDGDGVVDEVDEDVFAVAEFWESDGIDNDGDGARDESDEMILRLTCDVRTGWRMRRVTGWLHALSSRMPRVEGALALLDPEAMVVASGSDFLIDGDGAHPPICGMATTGDPEVALARLDASQRERVRGAGPAPSATTWTADPTAFFHEVRRGGLRGQFARSFYGGGTLDPTQLGDWTRRSSRFVLALGDQSISGNGGGYGILFVDGNLEISGDFEYHGVVFVTKALRLGGSAALHGAAFVGGGVTVLDGAPRILHSSEALALLRERLDARYVVTAILDPDQPPPRPRHGGTPPPVALGAGPHAH